MAHTSRVLGTVVGLGMIIGAPVVGNKIANATEGSSYERATACVTDLGQTAINQAVVALDCTDPQIDTSVKLASFNHQPLPVDELRATADYDAESAKEVKNRVRWIGTFVSVLLGGVAIGFEPLVDKMERAERQKDENRRLRRLS